MLPILINLGPVKIYSMGVMMLAGAIAGLYWWWKMGRDEHWDEIALFDAYFLAWVSYWIGGRAAYLLNNWEEMGRLERAFSVLTYPGTVYAVGVVAAWLAVTVFARAKEWEVWKVWDAWAVVTALILSWGGVGVLLNEERLRLNLLGVGWAISAFMLVSVVRKNFRFYEWYKGEASVAKDGLTSLVWWGLLGIYYLTRAVVTREWWGSWGIGLLLAAGVGVYFRSGKKFSIMQRKRK